MMQYDIEEERNKEKGNGVEQGEQVQVMEDNKEKRVLVLCPQRKPEWHRPVSFMEGARSLDHQHIYFHIQQQIMHGFDRLLLHHEEKVSGERRNLFLRRILAAARRLKAEEDEIGRKRCLSRALEERVHRLRVEAQMCRDVALSLEAVAGALRCDLDRGLAAAAAVGDTESACCRSDGAAEANRRMRKSACRSCREAEPSVVLLPCRHLCVCAACAPATVGCPVCSSRKRASVLVNMPH